MKAIVIPTRASLIVEAVLFLVVGILLCCSVSLDSLMNMILGIVLLVVATVMLVSRLVAGYSLLSGTGILAAFYGAIGILCLIGGFIQITPVLIMFLIVISSFLLVDSLVRLFRVRWRGKNSALGYSELVVGAAGLTLGLCLWFIDSFRSACNIVLGIIFILVAVVIIFDLILMNKKRA